MEDYVVTNEHVEPLLEGLAILGTGGGGSPEWGKAILEKELSSGRDLHLIKMEDIPDDALIVSGGIMGSVKTLENMSIEDLLNKWDQRFELIEASKVMKAYLGRKIDYVIPFEVGGLNTPVIMALAARLGIKTVDGDALGRSAPETQMTSFIGHGVSLTPMTLADTVGNTIIVSEQTSTVFADEIGRWMITKGAGMGANNHYPMSGSVLKRAAIPGSISLALNIGFKLLEARDKGSNPVESVLETTGGKSLFDGIITEIQGEDKGGFYITEVSFEGKKDYKGSVAKMVIKNETMVLWVNSMLKAVFPDLVCMLDPENGSGIMSVNLYKGKELSLIGIPCHPRLRNALKNPIASEAFGGARYGYPDLSFIPMEDLS